MNKYSISINGHRTSYSLETEFYSELEAIAKQRRLPLARMITQIDNERDANNNLSSALRLFVLDSLKSRLGESSTPGTSS